MLCMDEGVDGDVVSCSGDDELHAGEHASAAGRYQAVRAAMAARDRDDKQAARQARLDARAQKKVRIG